MSVCPQFNFVGRILGPRGMTTKELEQYTGCKIMVRGKGSMRDRGKVSGPHSCLAKYTCNWISRNLFVAVDLKWNASGILVSLDQDHCWVGVLYHGFYFC